MRRFTRFMIVGLTLLLTQIAIQAQASGSLSGTVNDPNGSPVAGASVTATKAGTGEVRSATTNDRGVFTFNLISPGTYSVVVENAGFKRALATDVVVSLSQDTNVIIALEIG